MKYLNKRYIYYLVGIFLVISSLSFKPIDPKHNSKYTDPEEKSETNFFNKKGITDGPYIFFENDKTIVKWILNDKLKEKEIRRNNYKIINKKFGFKFNPDWIKQAEFQNINFTQKYSTVESVIAVSDVHGQYDLLVKLLKEHNVIDNKFNWIFDKGHLVVLGDVMDRGTHVTEIIWLIYRLEQQAKEKGGMVHVMLGNHELMVLGKDLRYVHEKYTKSAELMSTSYDQLFSTNSFLGKWIRNKPVIVKINDMLFVHAGISPEVVYRGFSQTKINRLFANNIIGKNKKDILRDPELSLLRGKYGPVWYRGYFRDNQLNESEITSILEYFNAKQIIVGHTSMPNIVSLYNNKIIGIDSSIKIGDSGEILIFKNNEFYRGTSNGALIKL